MSILDRIRRLLGMEKTVEKMPHGVRKISPEGIPYYEGQGGTFIGSKFITCASCGRQVNFYALHEGRCPICKKYALEEKLADEMMDEFLRQKNLSKDRRKRGINLRKRYKKEEKILEEERKKSREAEAGIRGNVRLGDFFKTATAKKQRSEKTGMRCPWCQHTYHKDSKRCPQCGITNPLIDREQTFKEIELRKQRSIESKKPAEEYIPTLNKLFEKPPGRASRIGGKIKSGSGRFGGKIKSGTGRISGGIESRTTGKIGKSGRSDVICPACGESYDYKLKYCPCGEPNIYQDPRYVQEAERDKVKLSKSSREKVETELYSVLMFVIAGIAVLIVPQFLGFPISFMYLAIALMAIMPVYILLPGESEILKSLGPNEALGSKGWLLVPKAIFKLLFFGLVIYQFFMINLMLTLVIAFFFYFMLPIEFKNSKPFEAIESFFRMALGVYIAILFFMTFGSSPVGISLFFMALAFFVTLPVYKKEKEEGKWVIEITSKRLDSVGGGFEKVDRYVLFPIFMFASLLFSGVLTAFTVDDITMVMFILIWVVSFITGISAGSGGKPAIGILMILIAMVTFSSMYTGTIGQAVFGYFWPQVQNFTAMIFEPLSEMFYQAQSSMGDAWLMMTNPQQYYLLQTQKGQATKSAVKSGGTIRSMELSKFDIFPSFPGILEPSEPTIGSIELSNDGEFNANNIKLDIWSTWEDPVKEESVEMGTFKKLTCSGMDDQTPSGHISTCQWSGITYPDEIKMSTFIMQQDSWSGTAEDGTTIILGETEITDDGEVYTHSGQVVKINANYSYDYRVNVSIPIEVINDNLYITLLENRQITLQELTSQYTGGPVKATLWGQRQPLRDEESSLIVASIYNEGRGIIESVTSFDIYIPEFLGGLPDSVDDLSFTFDSCSFVGNLIHCTHNREIEPKEFKRVSFFIESTIDEDVDRRTSLIIGTADYRYIKTTTTQSLSVANAPPG